MPVFDLSEVDRYGAGVPRARHLLGTADRGRTAPQGRLYWLWTAGGRRGRGPCEVPKIVAFCRTPLVSKGLGSRSSGADLNSGGAEYGFCRLTKGTGAGFHWKVEHSRQLNTYRLNQSITATRYNPGVY